jgi:hypothetical protein
MGYNAALIGGFGIVAVAAAWLLCSFSGYTVAAWVAPLAISTFCFRLFVGATNVRFRVPILSHRIHGPHPAHHAIVELRGAF